MNPASDDTSAWAPPTTDHAAKIVASPIRVPTRSMNDPAGTWPIIMPIWNETAM